MIGVNRNTIILLLELVKSIIAREIRIDDVTVHNETVEDTINAQHMTALTGTRILTMRWYDKGFDNRREAVRKVLEEGEWH